LEIRLIFLCGLLVPILSFLGLDTILSQCLYSATTGWAGGDQFPWRALYEYGVVPAYAAALLSLVLLIVGCFKENMARYRRFSIYCLLVFLIGPGLIVNVILKDHWGRPRPRQVDLFGGSVPYHYVWQPGYAGIGKSFPCGHSAAGFFLITPYFALRSRKRRLALTFLVIGMTYGSLMGFGRIAQGGHFLSDVVGSGVIVYAVGLSLAYLFGFGRSADLASVTSDALMPILADGTHRVREKIFATRTRT
jgi:lipid A 4'-phosphatase